MKILIISSGDYFSDYGGGQIYVKNIVNQLKKENDVTVFSIKESINQKVNLQTEEGVEIQQFEIDSLNRNQTIHIELDESIIKYFQNYLKEYNFDIIHANGWKYLFSQVSKNLNTPLVVTAHHGGIVCPNGMLMNYKENLCEIKTNYNDCSKCSLSFVPGGKFLEPILAKLNKDTIFEISDKLKKLKNIPFISPSFHTLKGISHKQKCFETFIRNNTKVIAPSKAIYDVLLTNGINKLNIRHISHGVRLNKNSKNKNLTIDSKVKIGYVGRINYIKGLHVLINVLIQISNKNYSLHIYGSAVTKDEKKYLNKLKKKSTNLPVIFEKKVSHKNINEIYQNLDILIVPSICFEIFGLIVYESMTNKTPVIASKCGGPEDLIDNGFDGLLVKANDVNDLRKKLQKVLDNPEEINILSNNIKNINGLENHCSDLLNYYKELVRK